MTRAFSSELEVEIEVDMDLFKHDQRQTKMVVSFLNQFLSFAKICPLRNRQ